MKKRHAQKPKCVKSTTFNVDIAEEFNEIKNTLTVGLNRLDEKLDGFKNEINAWKQEFVKQLTILNNNMDKVISTIANHEIRITEIERKNLEETTKSKTIHELTKLMWFIAKGLITVGIVAGGIFGTAGALKIFFPM